MIIDQRVSHLQSIVDAAVRAGFDDNTVEAGFERYMRKHRMSHPSGAFDGAGRFYIGEGCACCRTIRPPSRAFPHSEMVHGRTVRHVATLYGVDARSVRCVADALELHGRRSTSEIQRRLCGGAQAAAGRRLAAAKTAHARMDAQAALDSLSARHAELIGRC